MVTRMREKGQVTIPSEIRDSLRLSKDSVLSVVKAGNGILLIPTFSAVESFAAKFSKAAEGKGISLEVLLRDLRKMRREK